MRADGFVQAGWIAPVMVVEVSAHFGGDGETRRDGESDAGHLGEIGALAAEQLVQRRIAIGAFAEREYVLRTLLVGHAMPSGSSAGATVPCWRLCGRSELTLAGTLGAQGLAARVTTTPWRRSAGQHLRTTRLGRLACRLAARLKHSLSVRGRPRPHLRPLLTR